MKAGDDRVVVVGGAVAGGSVFMSQAAFCLACHHGGSHYLHGLEARRVREQTMQCTPRCSTALSHVCAIQRTCSSAVEQQRDKER